MSISVHQNPDGTFTVTCGDASVIVGPVSAPAIAAPAWTSTGKNIIFSIRTKDQDDGSPVVGDVDRIENTLASIFLSPSGAFSTMKIGWTGRKSLDIDDLTRRVESSVGVGPIGIIIQAIDDGI